MLDALSRSHWGQVLGSESNNALGYRRGQRPCGMETRGIGCTPHTGKALAAAFALEERVGDGEEWQSDGQHSRLTCCNTPVIVGCPCVSLPQKLHDPGERPGEKQR